MPISNDKSLHLNSCSFITIDLASSTDGAVESFQFYELFWTKKTINCILPSILDSPQMPEVFSKRTHLIFQTRVSP